MSHFFTNSFDPTCDFVSRSNRQRIDRRYAGAVMRIRVADPTGGDANQKVGWAERWNGNLGILQRFAELHQADGFHRKQTLNAERPTLNVQMGCSANGGHFEALNHADGKS